MLKIGITGGIGSGKTTICKIFEVLGIPVFYADTVAKTIMNTDEELKQDVISLFGIEAYAEGALNRKYIADIVFNNEQQLQRLNAAVHPAVFRAFEKWQASQKNAPYVIKEAAVLFESGSYKMCDYSIQVSSPLELRLKRVMRRDVISQEQFLSRANKQLSDEEKEKLADFILINDESQLLIPQVLQLHHFFLSKI